MRYLLLGGLLASLLGAPAMADVLFTSFVGTGLGGDTTTSTFEGLQFTASASGQLGQVIFQGSPLSTSSPVTWPLTLYSDSGGEPGTPLESWNVTLSSFFEPPITLASVAQPTITAGDIYWLVLQNTTPASVADMAWEVYNGTSLGYFTGEFDTLSSMANAFPGNAGAGVELDSITTPEPAGAARWIGAACLLLVATLRMRKIAASEART
jgi:hypothetical protein